MFEELKKKKKRLEEIQGLLSDPKVISNSVLYQKYAREMSSLKDIVEKYNEYLKVSADVEESESIMTVRISFRSQKSSSNHCFKKKMPKKQNSSTGLQKTRIMIRA